MFLFTNCTQVYLPDKLVFQWKNQSHWPWLYKKVYSQLTPTVGQIWWQFFGEDCTTYLRIIEGKLPVVVDVAEVATVKASEASDVKSNTSWLTLDDAVTLSALVADLERTLLEAAAAAAAAAAAEAASQAGHGRFVL